MNGPHFQTGLIASTVFTEFPVILLVNVILIPHKREKNLGSKSRRSLRKSEMFRFAQYDRQRFAIAETIISSNSNDTPDL
jgi:hypothetical protein